MSEQHPVNTQQTPEKIVFLGTGNAFHTGGRCSQALLFDARESVFLVDVGPTTALSMDRHGVDPDRIDALFLTHLHGDHIAGWPFLLLNLGLLSGRSRPLKIYGPVGTAARLETLATACYPGLLEPDKIGFPLEFHELAIAPQNNIRVDPQILLDVLPMEHDPTSLGLRFRINGPTGNTTVTVSGDTRWCPNLESLAAESDLFICECTSVERMPYAHVSLDEIREALPALNVARTVLVHLSDDVEAALNADPIPGVQAARDGMVLSL